MSNRYRIFLALSISVLCTMFTFFPESTFSQFQITGHQQKLLTKELPTNLRTEIEPLSNGTFTATNQPAASFPSVKAISGDFDGDGKVDDIALVGGASWTTIPVASRGDSTFTVTNQRVADFPAWAAESGVKAVSGDFDGDGKVDDIALVGGASWTTIPVAYARGDGAFTVTNRPVADFPAWAAESGVKAVSGDFDGDGKVDDIALVGRVGWTTIPVAYARGDGTFTVTNQRVADFPAWAAESGVKAVSVDFDGGGKVNAIALVGGTGWTTIPVAYSRGGGTFSVTNQRVAGDFPNWAARSDVKAAAGDFNGDGKVNDIALVGGAGWTTIPVARLAGDVEYTVTNQRVTDFPAWAAESCAKAVSGSFDGTGKVDDIALVGGAGWTTIPVAYSRGNGTFTVTNQQVTDFPAWAAESCSPGGTLSGFVDMHTHPMARWAFGEELFWGENDGDPARALGPCQCFHRGWDLLNNQCGNNYREALVNNMDIPSHDTRGGAYPSFGSWPRHQLEQPDPARRRYSILHQQMWHEWVKRAKDSGLRVMVALAVNNHCLADAAETAGPNDDLRSMNNQIQKLKEFVGRHTDFMEIAYSPSDLRRIVGQNKLAVVIGIEMDNIGNFYSPADPKGGTFQPNPSETEIAREIDRLYGLGVRYIFPIHVTNNVFGGTALYQDGFNVANKYNTGSPFSPEVVDSSHSGISFKLKAPYQAIDFFGRFAMSLTGTIIPGHIMPNNRANYPEYPDPGPGKGHKNSLGLTLKGQFAIGYMMKKAMMIDIDHMSDQAAIETLFIATSLRSPQYPINSGHNGFRSNGGNTENSRTDLQLSLILSSGGMMGLGHGDEASAFLSNFRFGLRRMNNRQLAIGTDVNGLYPLPGPPAPSARITYDAAFPKCRTGSKEWDYNTEGFAHYGLFPDFIRSLEKAGMTATEKDVFFSSAEYFAQMWEKCLLSAANYTPPPPDRNIVISSLRITIRTGGDDLRGNSHVYAVVTLQSGERPPISLNNGAGWGNNSINTATISLPPGTRLNDITALKLKHVSGGCLGCSHDNWNLDRIFVEYDGPSGTGELFVREGTPLVRFTGSVTEWAQSTTAR